MLYCIRVLLLKHLKWVFLSLWASTRKENLFMKAEKIVFQRIKYFIESRSTRVLSASVLFSSLSDTIFVETILINFCADLPSHKNLIKSSACEWFKFLIFKTFLYKNNNKVWPQNMSKVLSLLGQTLFQNLRRIV